jgi:F-type H+-transporting ATPase subunit b
MNQREPFMRTLSLSTLLTLVPSALALAQEHGAETSKPSLVSIQINLMFWTLVIFLILFFLLRKFAFPAILGAVERREQALEEALASARRDREEAQRLLEEQRRQIEGARGEAQKFIAEGRAVAEKMRQDLLGQTRQEQQEMLERARREIDMEKERAIVQLRREAVNLAISGAGKVIEENLDDEKNRRLVDSFLESLPPMTEGGRRAGGSR